MPKLTSEMKQKLEYGVIKHGLKPDISMREAYQRTLEEFFADYDQSDPDGRHIPRIDPEQCPTFNQFRYVAKKVIAMLTYDDLGHHANRATTSIGYAQLKIILDTFWRETIGIDLGFNPQDQAESSQSPQLDEQVDDLI